MDAVGPIWALLILAFASPALGAGESASGLALTPGEFAAMRTHGAEPLALVDLVRYRQGSDRERFRAHLERLGGTIEWAGRVDQQFIGPGNGEWDDVVISEYPSGHGLLERLAATEPRELDEILVRRRTHPAQPWPWYGRSVAAVAFAILNLVGGGPAPLPLPAARRELEKTPRPPGAGADPLAPTAAQMRAFVTGDPASRVVMFNFLAYPPHLVEPSSATGTQSPAREEEYDRYGNAVAVMIGRIGGRLRWIGWPLTAAGGDATESWDSVTVVEYPSRAAFLGMVTSPAYEAITPHRIAGLERTEIFACTSWPEF